MIHISVPNLDINTVHYDERPSQFVVMSHPLDSANEAVPTLLVRRPSAHASHHDETIAKMPGARPMMDKLEGYEDVVRAKNEKYMRKARG